MPNESVRIKPEPIDDFVRVILSHVARRVVLRLPHVFHLWLVRRQKRVNVVLTELLCEAIDPVVVEKRPNMVEQFVDEHHEWIMLRAPFPREPD